MHSHGLFWAAQLACGGANVLIGDGSVRFLTDDIDQTLHRNLHSHNGGEVVSDFTDRL